MRSKTAAILGAPIACWALYGCLLLADVDADVAGASAIVWGVFWLALLQFGRSLAFGRSHGVVREGPVVRRPGGRALRTHFGHAVLASLFLPIPIYALSLLFDAVHVMPFSVTLPLFAMLGTSAPATFWWTVFRPEPKRDDRILVLGGWHPVERTAPAGVIPPRNSSARLAS